MKMNILLGLGTLGAALGLATSAEARVVFGVSLGIPVPPVVVVRAPVYYAPPPPVYYAPAAPAVAYTPAPGPVYYAPAPVYYPPAPVYYEPAPVVYGPTIGIGIGFGGGWHHGYYGHGGYGHGWRR